MGYIGGNAMKDRLKVIKKQINEREDLVFLIVSVLFGIIMSFARVGGDDATVINSTHNFSVMNAWQQEKLNWFRWSSRILVNFVNRSLLGLPRWIWGGYLFVSMYVLLKALSQLFVVENKKFCNLFIACLVLIMPWQQLSTAGWICTTGTYFGPVAFGIMGLVPIAKYYKKTRCSVLEEIFYIICLIYGTNIEQMMVIDVGCYTVAIIYFILKKINVKLILVNFCVTIMSVVNFWICPGNSGRKLEEEANWFPTFSMLNSVDKVDVGLFTTLRNIFLDNSFLFILIIIVMMTFIINKKYGEKKYKYIAFFPTIVLMLLGPFKNFLILFFPHISGIYNEWSEYGLFTVDNAKGISAYVIYLVLMVILLNILLLIILVSNSIEDLIVYVTILALGLISRIAIGVSPTIYASGTRTFEVFYMCIIIVGVKVFAENIVVEKINAKTVNILEMMMVFSIVISFVEIGGLVRTIF